MAELYFYAKGGQRQGPFTLEQLAGQEITPTTLVWRRGLTAWVKAGEFEELAALFAPAAAEAAENVEAAAEANPAEYMGGDVAAEEAFEAEAVRETEDVIDELVSEADEPTADEPTADEPEEEEPEDESDVDSQSESECDDAPGSEPQPATDVNVAESYFYAKGGQRLGPFTLDKLAEQEITPTTLVWRRGMTAWARAGELEELAALFTPAAAEAAETAEDAAEDKAEDEGAFEADETADTPDDELEEEEPEEEEPEEEEPEEDEPEEDESEENESEEEESESDSEFDPEYADAPDSEEKNATDDEYFDESKPERRKLYLICGAVVAAIIVGILILKTCSAGHEEAAVVEEYTTETPDTVCDDVTPTPPVAEPTPAKPAAETPAAKPAEAEKPAAAAATSDTREKLPQEEEKPSRGTKMRLQGYIDGQYEVTGSITIDGDNLTGRYAYRSTVRKYGDKSSSYIRLKGKIKPDGYFKAYGTNSASSRVENWQGRISGGTITAVTTGSDGSLMELDGTLE